ncbi:polyketide cyclase/dehydrase [Aestuariibacter salexigens]|uniref:polyketide cyclase/dehydrase n=1 Tax=Aestuariibacter salexigens TaxID=226010 RepID=UPI00041FCE32|nr:polyketide cyclase/dehydrase [Aestuariibacter salexigens]
MKTSIALATTLLVAPYALGDVTFISDNGFIVENRIETTIDSKTVWHALVNDVDKWWPKDHSWWGEQGTFRIDDKAGGCFCEIAGDRSAVHMTISFVDPESTLRMTGGLGPLQGMGMYGALDWAFSQQQDNTVVTLTYRMQGINPDGFEALAPIVDRVQAIQLNGLKQFVEN